MNEIGAAPGGPQIPRRDLGPDGAEGVRPGDANGAPGPGMAIEESFDRHDLHVMTQLADRFGEILDHTGHAARPGPIVLGQVKDAHMRLELNLKRAIIPPVHIAVLSHTLLDPAGRGKLRALAGLGVQVTALLPGGVAAVDGQVRLAPVEATGDPALPDSIRWSGRSLRRLLSDLRPDLLQIEEGADTPGAAVAAAEALRLGIPYTLFTWDSLPRKRALLENRRYRRVLLGAAGLIGGNRLAADRLATDAPHIPVTVLPQTGVTLPGHVDRRRAPEETALRIGFVGRLVPERGADLLLRAVAQVMGPWNLQIVGTGPAQEDLEALAQRLGLASRLVWHGAMDRASVDHLWGELDCLVVPSRSTATWTETFSPMLVRAMASGVAPIVTSTGALPDIVGTVGAVVTGEDDLALILQTWLAEPDRHRQAGEAARRRVLAEFADPVIAERTLAFWSRLLIAGP